MRTGHFVDVQPDVRHSSAEAELRRDVACSNKVFKSLWYTRVPTDQSEQ